MIREYKVTPDTYFYDSATSGTSIVRYKKVDGLYYLCDQNGNITSEESQDVSNITLNEYTAATSTNLTAGSAGFASGEFVLGDSTDIDLNKKKHKVYTKITLTTAATSNPWIYLSATIYVDGKAYQALNNVETGLLHNANGISGNINISTITVSD